MLNNVKYYNQKLFKEKKSIIYYMHIMGIKNLVQRVQPYFVESGGRGGGQGLR